MEFSYEATFREESPEAYERLMLDALIGDPTLFIRSDEVEQCWRIIDPIIAHWEAAPAASRSTRPLPGGRRKRTSCSHVTAASGTTADSTTAGTGGVGMARTSEGER